MIEKTGSDRPQKTSVHLTALFAAGNGERGPSRIFFQPEGRVSRYTLDAVQAVSGPVPAALASARTLVRLESAFPIPPDLDASEGDSFCSFRGMTRHLHYTNAVQRLELNARSHAELGPSGQTTAVLIPIRKSEDWWQLAQDERQSHFHEGGPGKPEGHTAIGMRYTDRIFRRLYHCRYGGAPSPYDFLTYFEFPKVLAPEFRKLLAELRDRARNPEWGYVENEFEIWATKVA